MVNKILLSTPTNEIKYETLVNEWSKSPFVFRVGEIRKYNMTWVHKDIEFEYILDGEIECTLNNKSFFASKGHTVCVNCYNTHKLISPNAATVAILMINNQFCIENGIDVTKLYFDEIIDDPKFNEFFSDLLSEFDNLESAFRDAAIRAAVLRILVYASRNYSKSSDLDETAILRSFGNAFEYTTRAINYINNNFRHKLSLEEIAAASGASKYHFLRTFKKVTGYTVTDYINQVRCKFAKEMLLGGDHSVKETAILSGFENLSHFTNTFKRYEDSLPSEFLKKKKDMTSGKIPSGTATPANPPCFAPADPNESEYLEPNCKTIPAENQQASNPGIPARTPCYMPLDEIEGAENYPETK